MSETINSFHIILTLIAAGVLIGLGWQLIAMAVTWPVSRVGGLAALVCALVVVLAWVVK